MEKINHTFGEAILDIASPAVPSKEKEKEFKVVLEELAERTILYARWRLGKHFTLADAEDMSQEVFIKLYEYLPSIKGIKQFSNLPKINTDIDTEIRKVIWGWLKQVMRRAVVTYKRRSKIEDTVFFEDMKHKQIEQLSEVIYELFNVEHEAEDLVRTIKPYIDDAFDSMENDRYRKVAKMKIVDAWSNKQIQDHFKMQTSSAATKQIIYRAIKTFREKLYYEIENALSQPKINKVEKDILWSFMQKLKEVA